MKKLLLIAAVFLLLTASAQSGYAQDKSETPAKDSVIRQAIFAAVKKRHTKISKEPELLLVQGVWARFVYKMEPEEEEQQIPSASPDLILKKIKNEWKIVWTSNTDGAIDKRVKGVPAAIKNVRRK